MANEKEIPAPGVPEVPADEQGEVRDNGGAEGLRPRIDLRVTTDRLQVLLDAPDPGEDVEPLVEAVAAKLAELMFENPPSRHDLADRIRAARSPGLPLSGVPLIRGRHPRPPVDGAVEWARDFFDSGFVVDEHTDQVDYRRRRGDPSVHAGQELATIRHPREGEPGTDVFGKPIRVRKPYKAPLRQGPNVESEEVAEGVTRMVAGIDGRLRFAEGLLAVDDVYTIRGHVGLGSGDISHRGAVVIQGDIKNGSTVKAAGEIVVQGMVEACHLEAGGNLTVRGGLVGASGFEVRVGGNVSARYMLDATIFAGGDVSAEREITHCRVRSRGQIQVPKGRIVGGDVSALGGVVVYQAGADGPGSTLLASGVDFRLEEMRAESRRRARRLEQRREKMLARARQLSQVRKLTPTQRDALRELRDILAGIDHEIAKEAHDLEEAVFHSEQGARLRIEVLGMIMPDTVLQVAEAQMKVMKRLVGRQNVTVRNGRISIVPA